MDTNKLLQLKKEILQLGGFKHSGSDKTLDKKLGPIKYAFPNDTFPVGAIHEFIAGSAEDATAATGFISGILAALMKTTGRVIWIGNSKTIFIPALSAFGISPQNIVFIDLNNEKEILWAAEEALKCVGLSAVVVQIASLSFTASRRLQLAVEVSRVTGFILRLCPPKLEVTACVTRWSIHSLISRQEEGLPGVGYPAWHIELLKVRNGKPASWKIALCAGNYKQIDMALQIEETQKKAI